ncbi:hypothetical protein HPB50_010436 [Hyalomma asiaticum]|uniref:Uncharacterized protein n=1 Tax=Hyalomma asiaticum TaxID=266040 RepID=A0ACB7T1Y4_HYAAI|nr:hypothetical protein HPB50_010436 [Hyalomma asiaticum]
MHRKRPEDRRRFDVPGKKRVHRIRGTESAQEADDLNSESDRDRGGRSSCEISDTAPVQVDGSRITVSRAASTVFNNLFELSAPSILPSLSRGYHSTNPKIRGMTTSALVTSKAVDIDQNMQVSVVVMGRRISTDEFHTSDGIATIEDVKTFLQRLHEMPICGGGPKASVYPLANPEVQLSMRGTIGYTKNAPFLSL